MTAQARSGPDDAEQALAQDIQATREKPGETAEALAAKADVKAQVREKASEISGSVRDKAAGLAQSVRSAAAPAASQVKERASAAGSNAAQAVPEPVQQAVSRAADTAKAKRAPLAASAAALALLLVCWRKVRRRR